MFEELLIMNNLYEIQFLIFFILNLLSDIKLVNSLSLNLKLVDNFITIVIVNCSSDFKLIRLISHYSKKKEVTTE